jgi:hypothetical protein
MPLQHQEHETGHDQRLQLRVMHIIIRTCEALKRQVTSPGQKVSLRGAVRRRSNLHRGCAQSPEIASLRSQWQRMQDWRFHALRVGTAGGGLERKQRCSRRQPTCTLPRRKPESTCRGGNMGPGFRRDRGPFAVSCPVGRQRRWGTDRMQKNPRTDPQPTEPPFPRKRESRRRNGLWIPALCFATAGMTNWDGARTFPQPAKRNGERT